MSLVIDSREKALQGQLTSLGVPFTTGGLAVGDIMIQKPDGQALLVAERKTHADFASSLMDGRYREQRTRLMATRGQGIATLYMLEGTWSDSLSRMYPGVSEVQLQRLTSRLILRYGMPVIMTASLYETAQWCARLLAQIQEDPEVFHPEKGLAAETAGAMATYAATFTTVKKGNRSAGSVAIQMLSAVPGLGAKKVTGLLGQVTIAKLASMTAEDIGNIVVEGKRLGKTVGQTLFEALGSK
jgi:ERCC4-type nuclease